PLTPPFTLAMSLSPLNQLEACCWSARDAQPLGCLSTYFAAGVRNAAHAAIGAFVATGRLDLVTPISTYF
ncbi:MAG: hypothetical protein ABIQ99_16885, partial [Thermoflexales bacterium]